MLKRLQRFWISRGRWAEGRALIEEALAATTGVETDERGEVFGFASELTLMQGDTAAARAHLEDGIALKRVTKGDSYAEIMTGDLGTLALRQGDLELAEDLLSRALDSARRHDKPDSSAVCLAQLAEVARARGDVDLAWERGRAALTAAREGDNENLALEVTSVLGTIAHQRGDYDTASHLYGEVLDAARRSNDMEPAIYILYCLASVALDRFDAAGAVPYLVEALTLGRDVDARADLCESLEATARLAAEMAEPRVAGRLLAAASSLRASVDFARSPVEIEGYEALVGDVRRQGRDRFETEWAEGGALAAEDAVAEALAYLQTAF